MVTDKNRRFYQDRVAPLIHERFGQYEGRIAVGIAGEGSDCFGFDDGISRDHDFGTGVCLWITGADMPVFGHALSVLYNELVDSAERSNMTARLRERRGVMTIHDFYSGILGIDCDTDSCSLTEGEWRALDHACLATAVNGEVFRDDLGAFSAFRRLLLDYYPDRVWRIRLAEELHRFASALQVNYARCMARGDIVAADICKVEGISAAMQMYFLLHRTFPPYYKWTYRALTELDTEGSFAAMVCDLAKTPCNPEAWDGVRYHPNRPNIMDSIVSQSEQLGGTIARMLQDAGMTEIFDPYLERYVNEVLA